MRVLVTGALGNIGSHTLPELVRQGHEVRGFDAAVAAKLGWRRRLLPLVAPLARASILRMSPYR
jgi:nucleoside-diphosphate-sugar epimerase